MASASGHRRPPIPGRGPAPGHVHARVLALATLLLAIVAGPASAEPPFWSVQPPTTFSRAPVEAELPQSSVYTVLEDDHGHLWFATREGVARWDGFRLRTWKASPFSDPSLPDNVVLEIKIDGHGDVWARTAADFGRPFQLSRIVGPDGDRVQRFDRVDAYPSVLDDGEVWVATPDSLFRFDRATERLVAIRERVETGRVGELHHGPDGTLFVGSEAAVVERYTLDGRALPVLAPASASRDDPIREIHADRDGTVWIGTLDGLRVVRPGALTFEPVNFAGDSGGAPSIDGGVTAFTPDPSGSLWIATFNGLFELSADRTGLQRHALGGLPDWDTQDLVTTVFIDRTGTVWAGTVWGLFQRRSRRGEFGHVEHVPGRADAIPPGIVLSISSEPGGALWVGTLGGGVVRLSGHDRLLLDEDPDDPALALRGSWVWDVHCTDDATWIATDVAVHRYDADGLHVLDLPELTVANNVTGDPVQTAYCLATRPGDPSIWIGGRGVIRLHPDGPVEEGFGPDAPFVRALLAEADELWIGTAYGLFRTDLDTREVTAFRHDPGDASSLCHDVVLCLHRDQADRLWVGTQAGLSWLDPGDGRFHHVELDVELPSSTIYGILEDDAGRLWISTNRGLARLDVTDPTGPRVRTFGPAEGVRNLEFNRRAFHRDAAGVMYFGGDRGLTYLRPESVRDVSVTPVTTIAAASITGRDGTRRRSLLGHPSIELGPHDTAISFELVAADYNDPLKNRFGTRLDGVDPFWRELDGRTSTYTNVPPGTYVLHARSATSDGSWGPDATLTLVVTPPFHATTWFRALVGTIAVLLVAGAGFVVQGARYRRALRAREAVEARRRALSDERERISRDMHDEVGARLTEISILSELERRRTQDRGASPGDGGDTGDGAGPGPGRVDRIAESSRALLDELGQIIWAIDPGHDRLDQLVAYVREFVAEFIEGAGIRGSYEFPPEVADVEVSAQFRRNVFLVVKEATRNAVVHGRPSAVTVRLAIDDRGPKDGKPTGATLEVAIVDDGVGFDPARGRAGGNGLRNLRHRAEEIGGTLDITSVPGQGSTVRLRVPIDIPVLGE